MLALHLEKLFVLLMLNIQSCASKVVSSPKIRFVSDPASKVIASSRADPNTWYRIAFLPKMQPNKFPLAIPQRISTLTLMNVFDLSVELFFANKTVITWASQLLCYQINWDVGLAPARSEYPLL